MDMRLESARYGAPFEERPCPCRAEHAPPERSLGRLEQFDERSRAFPVTATITVKKPRSYHWSIKGAPLDQGREGACVGFAWAHELRARPALVDQTTADAMAIYRAAQRIDEWPGESYDGTSVLAGAKVLQGQGLIGEYRWAFGLDDLIMALGYKGPAVLGIPWYESMYRTVDYGGRGHWVRVAGRQVGGHAILARGVSLKGEFVTLYNSWGPSWGDNGSARITFADLDRLLRERGEACIPVKRYR